MAKMGRRSRSNYVFSVIVSLACSTLISSLPAVQWYAPFFSGGGYCSEAIAFVQTLEKSGGDVSIVQHGDSFSQDFVSGLPLDTIQMLQTMNRRKIPSNSVSICHSEPGYVQFK